MDALAHPLAKQAQEKSPPPAEVGSVADFVELVNTTVGKHFKCCICLSIFSDPVMLPCNHPLCRGCAKQSLRQHQRCPLCQASVPNLRMLQGRNKWIVEMVDSLRNCLNEVGASLTQHAPVSERTPTGTGTTKSTRSGLRYESCAPPPPPSPPSCGCGGGGSAGEASRAGTDTAAGRSQPAHSPLRQATAHLPPPPLGPPPSPGDLESVEDDAISLAPTLDRSRSGRVADDGALRDGVHAFQPGEGQGGGLVDLSGTASPSPDVVVLAPALTPPVPERPFVVGDVVFVEPRTWPGMNKHGGVAIVSTVLDPPGSRYHVKYSVGHTVDRGVEARFVHAYSFDDNNSGSRSRRRSGIGDGGRPSRDIANGRGGGGSVSRRARTQSTVADATTAVAAASSACSPVRTSVPWNISGHGQPSAAVAAVEAVAAVGGDQTGDSDAGAAERDREAARSNDASRANARSSSDDEDQEDASEEVSDSDATMSVGSESEEESDVEMEESDGLDGGDFNGDLTEEEVGGEGDEGMNEGDSAKESPIRRPSEDGKDEGKPANEEEAAVTDTVGSGAPASGVVEAASESRLGNSQQNLWLRSTTAATDDVLPSVVRRREHDEPASGCGAEETKATPPPLETPQDRSNASPVGRSSKKEGAEMVDKNADTPLSRPGSSDGVGHHHLDVGVDKRSTSEAANSLLSLSRRHSCTAVSDDRTSPDSVNSAPKVNCSDRDPPAGSTRSGPSPTKAGHGDGSRDDDGSSRELVERPTPEPQRRPPCPAPAELVTREGQQRSPQQMMPPPPPLMPPPPNPASPRTPTFLRTATSFSTPFTTPAAAAAAAAASPAYKVGDLVEVLSRSSPGVNKEGGVARVTLVRPDGTYNVKYCVRQGSEKGVAAAIISRYTLDGDGSDGVAVGSGGVGSYGEARYTGGDGAASAGKAVTGYSLARRAHRTNRGKRSLDAAVGKFYSPYLNHFLGDTQHPELDIDLGEGLDPDERFPEGGAETRQDLATAGAAAEGGVTGWMNVGRGKGTGGGNKSGSEVDGKSTGEVQGRDDAGEKGGNTSNGKRSGSDGDRVERHDWEGADEEDPRRADDIATSACARSQEEDTAPAAVDHGGVPSRGRGSRRATPKKRGRSPRAAARPDAAQRRQSSGGASAVTRRGRPAGVVLTLSGLTPEMTRVAKALASSHGWKVEPKYTEAVTHVVCGAAAETNKSNIRSAKFLRAVASGKWVVNGSWLQECKLRGTHAKEDSFEISGDKKSAVPSAPRRSRLAHADPNRPGLFHGITFHFRGEFGTESPPRSELEPMLLANGGTIVETMGSLFAAQPASDGNSNGGHGNGGMNRGKSSGVGSSTTSSSSSGGWAPRRVVIFQPRMSSPDADARALARELADRLARSGDFSSGSPKGGGGGGGGVSRVRDEGLATAEVVRPVWLVDSVGCFRVLKPTEMHRVALPCASECAAMEL